MLVLQTYPQTNSHVRVFLCVCVCVPSPYIVAFPLRCAIRQAFSDYQMQQMTSHFIDQFGFSEEDFTKQEDNVK